MQTLDETATYRRMNGYNGGIPTMAVTVVLAVLLLGRLPSQAEEKVKNGDFSAGLTEWDCKAYDRDTAKPSRRKSCEIVGDGPGNKAVQVTLDPKEFTHISQEVRLRKSQKKLKVSVRVKMSADYIPKHPALIIYLEAPDMKLHSPLNSRMFPLPPGGEWQVLTADLQSFSKGSTIEFTVRLLNGTGTVWIDDIVVDALEPAATVGGTPR